MINRYSGLLFVAHLFFTSILFSGTTGKISGKVTDSKSKEGIPSAVVTVVGTSLGAASDPNGNYVIVNVPPGTYSITVSYIGYQSTKITNIGVNVDYTTTLNIQLRESSVELNEYVVEGERTPLIRQDQTNPVVAVTAENIQTLPVTSIAEIIGLQAGVVTDDDGALHVRGGRSNEISFTLNGISVNNPYNNLSSVGVATNAVQEVTVSTGTFSAEYGNALSGVVNYVTKEGSSKLSGSIRGLTGDYYSTDASVFPHLKNFTPLNTNRVEATFGGPTPIDGLSFYTSGVFSKSGGYLYTNRIYNTTDMFVSRDEFTSLVNVLDTTGQPTSFHSSDPRYFFGRKSSGEYYFNPFAKRYTRFGNYLLPDTLGDATGDSALVPLSTSQSYNIQGNISYRFSSTMKLKYEFVFEKGDSKSSTVDGSRNYWYNPDGRPTEYTNSLVQSLDWTNTISNSMFYTAKFSYTENNAKVYTYENIHDSRYLPSFYQTSLPNVVFLTGGTYNGRTFRTTSTMGGKIDLQSQLFDVHEVKAGAELRLHTIKYENYNLEFYDVNDPSQIVKGFQDVYADGITYAARIPSKDNGYTYYKKYPVQFSSYVQDKIELEKSMILNIGLRYEYFDPASKYNDSISADISSRSSIFLINDLKNAPVKHMLMPRFSISYPITDQGTIRFSYGHFYQLANLSRLYANPDFNSTGTQPAFGNANVKPQQSIQYEIGLQQGLTPDLRLEVTGFYKDVRDYIYSQLVITSKGDIKYNIETNLSYANVRGMTISLFQRRAPGSILSSSIDYTFSVAEGNRTEPAADFFYSEKSGKSTETYLVPLDFDRTHVLNANLNLSEPDNYSVSTIFRLQTGTSYTPSLPASLATQLSTFIQNSAYKPLQYSIDLKIEKYFVVGDLRYSIFAQVDNLLDTRNETSVYGNSGRALYNANVVASPTEFQTLRNKITAGNVGMLPIAAIDNYYINPLNVSAPRLVRFGVSVLF